MNNLQMYKSIIVQKPYEMNRTQKVQTFSFQKSSRVFDPLCTTPCFAHSSHPQAISS